MLFFIFIFRFLTAPTFVSQKEKVKNKKNAEGVGAKKKNKESREIFSTPEVYCLNMAIDRTTSYDAAFLNHEW